MAVKGTTGDDDFTGTGGADVFFMGQGGNDTVHGGGGADSFRFGASFGYGDHVDGGAGVDTLVLDGDYATHTLVSASELTSIEKIAFMAGHAYDFAFQDGVIAHGQSLTIKADGLAAGDVLSLDFGVMTDDSADTRVVVYGGAGGTTFYGNAPTLIFHGGSGSDTVDFGDGFSKQDRFDGGGGNDRLTLFGDYSQGLVFNAAMLKNVESIVLGAGFDYRLTMSDANVASGATLAVFADGLEAADSLVFNGSRESDGHFIFFDGAGDDLVQGGALNDQFVSQGGDERFYGNDGGDTFDMGGSLTALDRIDGGKGADTLALDGDYSAGLTFRATSLASVEFITLAGGHDYTLTMNDANVDNGRFMAVMGASLGAGDQLSFDGSAEIHGKFLVLGGAGDDTLIAGQTQNVLAGGLGRDHLTGGAGTDGFSFFGAADSTGAARDVVTGFDAAMDAFTAPVTLNAIDAAVTHGTLSEAAFDTDLASAIGTEQLGIHDAVLFTPDQGDLAGLVFLVVDCNGMAGYQAGQDLVIQLEDAAGLAGLSTGNFA